GPTQGARGLLPLLRYRPIDSEPLPTLVQGFQLDFAVLCDCPKCESFARNRPDPGAEIGAARIESRNFKWRRVTDLRSLFVFQIFFEAGLWKLASQYQRSV